mgnify:FL=1
MKILIKILSTLIILIFITVIVLSYGITTKKFNYNIISQIEKRVPNSKVNIKEVSILLDLLSFRLKLKINEPEILIDEQNINIKTLIIFSDLISSFQKKYLLQKIELDFDKNNILKFKKISLIKKIPFLDQTKFLDGFVKGKLVIDRFQQQRSLVKFNGELKNISIDIYDDLPFVNDLSSKISYDNNYVYLFDLTGMFGKFKIKSKEINYSINQRSLEGNVNINGKLLPGLNLNKIFTKFLDLNLKNIKDIAGSLYFDANINIKFNKNYKIIKDKTNFNLETKNLKFIYSQKQDYIFDKFNSFINFDRKGKVIALGDFILNNKKNNFKIKRKENENLYEINLDGKINLKEILLQKNYGFTIKDDFNYSISTKLKNFKKLNINAIMDLKNSEINIPHFNYIKNKGVSSKISFNFYKEKKKVKITQINYISRNDQIFVKSLLFDEKFKLKKLEKIKINLGQTNELEINQTKKNFIIYGKKLDLSKLLVSKNKNNLEFNSLIDGSLTIDLKKIFLPSATLVNYKNQSTIRKGTIVKLNSFANFNDMTTFFHEIKINKANNKEIILSSDKAKPFLSSYDFLKGLEKGTLNVKRQIINKDLSITEININNFYLKEMPILTNILSIASLTGALDILEGKGIFFKEAYLKYELYKNELKIIECYGTGPSLGFIIEGRVGSDDFISLKGNLAPANMINNIVRGIPVIGKVLSGKKGDGIFGASFKIKGNKDLQTEVNPIKTLTPRFIQRLLSVFKK